MAAKQGNLWRDDFKLFLYIVWKHLGLPDPTPIQYEIADYLQYGADDVGDEVRREIIEGYRGVGKSWITSAFVVWTLDRTNQKKVLVLSATKERADAFSIFCKRLIHDIPFLNYLIPNRHQRDSNLSFDVGPATPDHAPSVKSIGISGQITGSRADLIVADDVETPLNSWTVTMREKIAEAVKEFDAVIKPQGQIMYLGTPQSEETLYNILRERGYGLRIWPARYPREHEMVMYEGTLAPMLRKRLEEHPELSWEPTDPRRFDEQDLLERELSFGKVGFQMQYMLNPSPADADKYPLKLRDLITTTVDDFKCPLSVAWGGTKDLCLTQLPSVGLRGDRFQSPLMISKEWENYESGILVVDPSGRGADETAYAVIKQGYGKLYLCDLGGLKGGYSPETLEALALVAKKYKVNNILIESNFGDGMFTSLLSPIVQRVYPCGLEEVRHHIQKEKRICDTIEPVMTGHKLVVDSTLVEQDMKTATERGSINYSLFYQMTRVTREKDCLKHDDRLDVLAMGLAFYADSMARQEEELVDDYRNQALDDMLEDFLETNSDYTRPKDNSLWTIDR